MIYGPNQRSRHSQLSQHIIGAIQWHYTNDTCDIGQRSTHRPRQVCVDQSWCKTGPPKHICGWIRPQRICGLCSRHLRWLKLNCLLGEASMDMQVNYLGTCLTGKVQEWFYRNVEWYDYQVHKWTLETVVQVLQKRFLHTLTHHHTSNKFDMVSQRTKTI